MNGLIRKAKTLKPLIRIGKKGITDAQVKELNKLLSNRRLVKIRMFKSSGLEKKQAAEELAVKTRSSIISSIGNTLVLYR